MSTLVPLSDQVICNGIGQVPAELDRVRDLYVDRAPLKVLEIGVWFGGTLREWLTNAAAGATVVAVDPEHQSPNKYEEWRKTDTTLVVGTGRSSDVAIMELVNEHAPYDWAFIDGDHSEDGVRFDVNLVKPLMSDRGLILLHDIVADGYPPLPPRVLFDELRAHSRGWEIVEPTPSWYPADCAHGIGVLQL